MSTKIERTGVTPIREWGLERRQGHLFLDGHDLTHLADVHGTPLHVASARILRAHTGALLDAFAPYPGKVRVHFSYKTNNVAGILQVLHRAGLGAEVVSGYELQLARRLGVPPDGVVFNGPNKRLDELAAAVDQRIGLIVVDNLIELERLEALARQRDTRARIALRVCPDIVPRHMNASSLTGSRRNQFGLDLPGGEVDVALARTVASPHLTLRGVMAHVGSGIHDLAAFRKLVDRLLDLQAQAWAAGARPDLLDVGGGLGTRHSRELTTFELLRYLGTGHLPRPRASAAPDLFRRYAETVWRGVEEGCAQRGLALPTLVLEPGRALVSDAQLLLLRVGVVRERPGVGRFALVDGGAMTVSMMFLSEYHHLVLANREAPDAGVTSIFGSLPSPMDVVYRRCPSPELRPGDLLAVLDSGAYFTATATNFGGPRPAVVLLDGEHASVVRRAETFEDLMRCERVLSD